MHSINCKIMKFFNNFIKVIGALSLVVSVGCFWQKNETHVYPIYIDGVFDDNSAALIMNAAEEWSSTSGNFLTFERVWDNSLPDTISVYADSSYTMKEEFGGAAIGETSWDGHKIEMIIPRSDASFRQTALHELGHAIGLKHSWAGTVMCWSVGCSSSNVTCEDIRQLSSVWNKEFDSETLPICENQ